MNTKDETSGGTLDELGELVLECLERIERSGFDAVEELCREHPGRADALRSRMRTLIGTGLLDSESEVPERLGDFVLGQRLGAGGMGVVYAAVQESLGREVALKLVRPDQLFFPEARARFRREVEVIARLQHRGITAVHTVGEERGIPYFAMERHHGATLAEVLAELTTPPASADPLRDAVQRVTCERQPDSAREDVKVGTDLFQGSWTDACLRIGYRVAEALDHAHGAGVLHRDIKPSNIMITVDGRVLLIDFGLASSSGNARLTTTGSRVGSLAYMAPEQIQGESMDVRTDVYGLGATLCELLSLRPPHADKSGEALAQAILRGEPVSIRDANHSVSRDTETVCRKALERAPTRRYADANAFARDLQNVLSRRPIEARRTGPMLRVWRWTQRNPARAAALALAILAPTALAVQQTVSARRIAEQRDLARLNLEHAVDALEQFLWHVGRSGLQGVPQMEQARLEMLTGAVESMDTLLEQQPDDPEMLLTWARMQRSTAEMLSTLERFEEAERRYRLQLDVLRSVPPDEQAERDLLGCLNNLALVLEQQGRSQDALATYREARELLAPALETAGAATDNHLGAIEAALLAATIERNLANLLESLGDTDGARAAFRAAVDFAERAWSADPSDDHCHRLAQALAGLGDHLRDHASIGEARPLLKRAVELHLDLAARQGIAPDLVDAAANTCLSAGSVFDHAPAIAVLREGLALAEVLVRDHAQTPAYLRTLAGLRSQLGVTLIGRAPDGDVEAALAAGLTAAEHVIALAPDSFENMRVLGLAGRNLAIWLVSRERRKDALHPATQAVTALENALALQPDSIRTGHDLAWAGIQEAYARVALRQPERAEQLAQRAPELDPNDAGLWISKAEILALCSQLVPDTAAYRERAFDALEQGLQLGFANLAYLEATPEFESVRDHARFRRLLEDARSRQP